MFCIPTCSKGFHRFMVNAHCKQSNVEKLLMLLSFIVLKLLITCCVLFIYLSLQEAQSILQVSLYDLCHFTDKVICKIIIIMEKINNRENITYIILRIEFSSVALFSWPVSLRDILEFNTIYLVYCVVFGMHFNLIYFI